MDNVALTKNQQLVLQVLTQAQKPLSAYEILYALHGDGLHAPTQVYRALQALQTLHMIHKIDSRNAFVICKQDHHQSTIAFKNCIQCGTYTEITLDLAHIAALKDFTVQETSIEIKGTCSVCAKLPKK